MKQLKTRNGTPYYLGTDVDGNEDAPLFAYKVKPGLTPYENLLRMDDKYWGHSKKESDDHPCDDTAWPSNEELVKLLGVTEDEIDDYIYGC